MSECVVRMDMPECCDECPMEYDGVMCRAIHTPFYPEKDGRYLEPLIDPHKERLPNCPIVCLLTENHGRLVDADEMLKKIENYHRYMTVGRESDPRCIIEDSPTIVQAERRANDGTD